MSAAAKNLTATKSEAPCPLPMLDCLIFQEGKIVVCFTQCMGENQEYKE